MRPFSRFVLVIALVAASTLPALPAPKPQDDAEVIRFVRVPTRGPVVLNAVGGAGRSVDSFRDIGTLKSACVSFTNRDARVAKSVRVQFVFFNGGGDRSDGTLLTRNGTFSTGVHERAANPENNRVNREDCVQLHEPHGGFSAVVAYIERVDFADGSTWSANDVHIADHVEPGSSSVAYAFVAPPPASNAVIASGIAVATGELPPVLAGTPVACAQVAPAPGNVFVAAQPGVVAPGNLFNIGDASVCVPSGNPAHDAEAVQLVKEQRVAIREPQVFRVYFPALSTSPACNDDVRLLNRVMVDATPTIEMVHPPKAGEYITIVHVRVGPDGLPVQASTSKSAGPPEFDDAARRSALASRYWPAIVAGKPVGGAYDFAMRWVVDPTTQPANLNRRDFTRTRVFGPAVRAAAAGCAA